MFQKRKVVVLGGGTATNSLIPCFKEIGSSVAYVLPVSDNGGSTSEILRVIGGPAIGDIRSRIIRVIEDPHLAGVLGYRLPDEGKEAKMEWNAIVEGSHGIWSGVPGPLRECVRPFLAHIQSELLKRSKVSKPFQFGKASVGNLFLTGARLFLGSLDAAIELLMRIGLANSSVRIVPCINSNHMYHISALLENGVVITGQSQISHPSVSIVERYPTPVKGASDDGLSPMVTPCIFEEDEEEDDATPSYVHPDLKKSQLYFEKMIDGQPLSAPVKRMFYINPYGEEIFPNASSMAVQLIKGCDMVIYSIGSLVTSLLPMLILGKLAEVIVESKMKKVLLVNGSYDRETFGMSGLRYVNMIIEAMETATIKYKKSRGKMDHMQWPATAYITDIVCLKGGQIHVERRPLESRGIRFHDIDSNIFESEQLLEILSTIG